MESLLIILPIKGYYVGLKNAVLWYVSMVVTLGKVFWDTSITAYQKSSLVSSSGTIVSQSE
jgi:hypothetical protein